MILTIIIYYITEEYLKNKKIKRVISSSYSQKENLNLINNFPFFVKKYVLKVKNKLSNLDYPYNLKFKNYLIIKYVFSVICLIISIINKNNMVISLSIFCIVFCLPNLLIKMFKNNEKIVIINELRNITNAIMISMSASVPFEEAINSAMSVIKNKRLRKNYEIFTSNYRLSGYNLKKSINQLVEKFDYYEVDLFASTLINSEKEGNVIQALMKYNVILDISYSKYLAKENSKRLMYLTSGTVISLFNIIVIVMYPIFVEVSNNLQMIFK